MYGDESSTVVPPGSTGRRGAVRSIALVLLGVLLAVAVGALGMVFGMGLGQGDDEAAAPPPVPVPDAPAVTADPVVVTEEPAVLQNDEIAEKYGDSVFKVEAEGCHTAGYGTAWVLDERHLVTNWHVVRTDPAPDLVSRDGRTTIRGTVIGGHLEPDVAVIRVDEPLPDALPWAETDQLREGQEIVSIGYPAPAGDFSVTPSTILSFQMSGPTREAIRGDGALDRGNSGGPALTRDGEVAGVATVMVKEAGQLQMVPLLFTTDALRPSVEEIVQNPRTVDADCEADFAELPDDWAPDFDGWYGDGPVAYGDDAVLDRFYDGCAAGDLRACDDLWWNAPYGSEYEAFATSCGVSSSAVAYGSCEMQAEWERQEAEWAAEQQGEEQEAAAAVAALLDACQQGDMQACDDLQWEADYGSREADIADQCGGLYPDGWGSCVDRAEEAAALQALFTQCQAGQMQACDDLYWDAPSGSDEEAVAQDCGGRYPGDGGMCVYRERNG